MLLSACVRMAAMKEINIVDTCITLSVKNHQSMWLVIFL